MSTAKRYFAGKAPEFVDSDSSESESEQQQQHVEREVKLLEVASLPTAPSADSRLLRLNKLSIVKTDESFKNKNDDDADAAKRRLQLRERALRRRQLEEEEDEAERAQKHEINKPVSEASDSEEDDSDEEIPAPQPLLKPLFLSKADRLLILKQKKSILDKNSEEGKAKEREDRRKQAHSLVEDELRRDMQIVDVTIIQQEVDDTDGLNEDEEYESWKLRELLRIRRDNESAVVRAKEIKNTERRRKMTDAEVTAENERLNGPKKEKAELNYLQRYYHKGAFFGDDESEVMKKDYMQPTLDDRFNKELLPEVMQVKNFGKAGRTKWTHLTKEDTSLMKAERSEIYVSSRHKRTDNFAKPTTKKRKD